MMMFDTAKFLLEMESNQWKSQSELEEIQQAKLRQLIAHAETQVPYYKNHGTSKILKKSDVRSKPSDFISTQHGSLIETHTSGSTGMPMRICSDLRENAFGVAFELHHLFETGHGILDTQAKISHTASSPNILQRIGILECHYLDVQAPEISILDKLKKLKADSLNCYPSFLNHLARINDGLRFKRIYCGGEVLTEKTRKAAEESFSCKVFNRYGSMETSWFAWECEKGSMHIQADQFVVEIVDGSGKPAKSGNILVTPLWRRTMPFIRYALGDRASWGSRCTCGRSLPTLKSIEGRLDDAIILPSGKVRSARSINLMDEFDEIISYRIIQEKKDLFVFRYVPAKKDISSTVKKQIENIIIKGCLNEKVKVEFEPVNKLQRTRTGKIRTVISKVKK